MMLKQTVAEVLRSRWLDLNDEACWCEVNEPHIYCCVRPEAILRHPIDKGALFHCNDLTYEVCMVEHVNPTEGEDWMLIYAHPREDDVPSMTKEEWDELYGGPDLASGSGLDTRGDRGNCHHLRVHRQVATREQ